MYRNCNSHGPAGRRTDTSDAEPAAAKPSDGSDAAAINPSRQRSVAKRGPLGWLLLLSLALVVWSEPANASDDQLKPLNHQEQERLQAEKDARRRFRFELHGRRYLGGLSYQISNHNCSDLWAIMENPVEHFSKALPATRSVKRADPIDPNKLFVTHGTALINGSYTVDLDFDDDRHIARFWLDASKPKDVEDIFGYFKLTPFDDRCMITAGVAVDPGQGFVASMFEAMIHRNVVRVARRIARYAQAKIPDAQSSETLVSQR